MKQSIKDFFNEIKNQYNYTDIKLDENYNFTILSDKGNNIFVPYANIKEYYNAYINSTAPREVMIARAVGYLTNLAKG